LRDNTYDMVGFQEQMKYGRKSGVQLGDFDIGHFAAAFGATGIRVTGMHEFVDAFKQSLDEPGISIIDVRVDYSHTTDLYAQLHEGVLN
jgi:acetolactate synthase I/II/III large subunit